MLQFKSCSSVQSHQWRDSELMDYKNYCIKAIKKKEGEAKNLCILLVSESVKMKLGSCWIDRPNLNLPGILQQMCLSPMVFIFLDCIVCSTRPHYCPYSITICEVCVNIYDTYRKNVSIKLYSAYFQGVWKLSFPFETLSFLSAE